jgi:transposase
LKNAREQMDIVNAYAELGSYRAAAAQCGTTHKTVRRVIEGLKPARPGARTPRPRNTDGVAKLTAEKVRASDGRISAKRLLPIAKAAGYVGSARNFRRVVAVAKQEWRGQRRVYRPWVATPGEHLVIDWGTEYGLQMFCAVLPWSHDRFVRFAENQQRETTLDMLSQCFDEIGGVPAMVLADRMGCLKGGTVAGVVVPHPDYVRFATHYGFRPDFCEAADPESKGIVEALVGYAKADLVVPAGGWPGLEEANRAAREWCREVNGRVHSEIAAVPTERLLVERTLLRPLPTLRPSLHHGESRQVDKLSTVRFGSARYSVPIELKRKSVDVSVQGGAVVICYRGVEKARHPVRAPGEVSLLDEHYGSPAKKPIRAFRPRSKDEIAFLGLGPVAERFLRSAAAEGTPRLASELAEIVALEAAWGREALVPALERAERFRRWRAADVRAILAAWGGLPTPSRPGQPLLLALPVVPVRPLAAYALEALR